MPCVLCAGACMKKFTAAVHKTQLDAIVATGNHWKDSLPLRLEGALEGQKV
jgi:hypothetical protein